MAENLVMAPRLSGVMLKSTEYTNLGLGDTDRTMLLGHCDGLDLNTPYPVTDLPHIVEMMGSDSSSPLLRGLLEAYYAGCRDLWVTAVAPMSEYESDFDARLEGDFYQTYADRLQVAYDLLVDFESPQLIVPINAPIFGAGDVDFLTPLATFCSDSFDITGSVKIGFIGTALTEFTAETVEAMATDTRIDDLGSAGKFVVSVIGSAVMNMTEIPVSYSTTPTACLAGLASTSNYDRGLTYQRIPNAVAIDFPELSKTQYIRLCEARLNPLSKTTRSRRRRENEVVMLTDNTLGAVGSDFWSFSQVHLIMRVVEDIRTLGNRHLGTVGYGQFQQDVQTYMMRMISEDVIRDFTLQFGPKKLDKPNRGAMSVDVDVSLKPYFGIRDIFFTAKVGPGS